MGNQKTVVSRGLLPIYYSTTSGMSKDLANKFQSKAEDIGFVAPVMNVGDIVQDAFLQYQGPAIMFISTYGNGDAAQDGETFLKWLQNLKEDKILKKLSFIILALGNSTFQHFCGSGRKFTEAFLSHGAQMLIQTKKCDASIQSQSAPLVFESWSQKVLDVLTLKYNLKNIPLQNLTGGFKVQISSGKIDWEEQMKNENLNLNKQFSNYVLSPKAEVIHIKQLRNDSLQSGRSTLWLRIKKPQTLRLWPGCNVNIYPENVMMVDEEDEEKIIQFKSQNGNSKIPFPPMNISDLKKLVNLRQKPSNKLLKNAILLSSKSNEVKDKYKQLIRQNKIQEVTCASILEELDPSYEFYADLGLNMPRAYTLASWKEDGQYFDLCLSTVKDGLCSTYLKSLPKQLRINSFESTFSVPQKPLIMIANGSGIAPFRSIVQYVASQQPSKRIPLKLYYGIQNSQVDYYFKEEFQKFEALGIIEIKLAESRKDPTKKTYVQQIIQQDKQMFREHLFRNQGLIYICGGKQMQKAVNAAIFKAITLECKLPYKGFTILNNFKSKHIIVQQVFG